VGNDYAWWANSTTGEAYTHVVGQKLPNAWNLYDMSGNAAEWVRDHYGVYPVGPLTNPNGPQNDQGYVIRGGDYNDIGAHCRSAARDMAPPETKRAGLGFRVAHP
jgi:formylglycine-generating enzyme required for sulfatase activity